MRIGRWLACALVLMMALTPIWAQSARERVDILIGRYIDQRDTEKCAEALQTMLKARDLLPRDAEVWGFLGEAYRNLGRRVDAIEAFRRARELGSDSEFDRDELVKLLCDEAEARADAKQFTDADRLVNEARRVAPDAARPWGSSGYVHYFAGRRTEAIEAMRKARQIDPEYEWARETLGVMLAEEARARVEAGDLMAAERLLLEAHRLAPDDAEPLFALGAFHEFNRRDPAQANLWYERALQKEPTHVSARGNLAGNLNEEGRFAEAEQHCRAGLALADLDDHERWWLRWRLVVALVGQERHDEAAAVEDAMLAAGGEIWSGHPFAETLVEKAKALVAEGQYEAATVALCLVDRRPYATTACAELLAASLQLQHPGEDLAALEARAASLVSPRTAATAGALLSRCRTKVREGKEPAQAHLLGGPTEAFALGSLYAEGDALVGGFLVGLMNALADTGSIVVIVDGMEIPCNDLAAKTVLTNDLGAEVYPDLAATRWLSFLFDDDHSQEPSLPVEPVLVFPAVDAVGKILLDPSARNLALSLTADSGEEVRFEWGLPLQQSRLAHAAWSALPDSERRHSRFLAAQCAVDLPNRLLLFRVLPEGLTAYLSEGALSGAGRESDRVIFVHAMMQGHSAEALAARLRLLGSHGEQVQAELVSEPAASEDLFTFDLKGQGGRSLLDDTDGRIRIVLLSQYDEAVAATYEFPRRETDLTNQ